MNQSLDVVSLLAGVVYVAVGVWLLGDAMGSRPPLALLVPAIGVLAVLAVLLTVGRVWTNPFSRGAPAGARRGSPRPR